MKLGIAIAIVLACLIGIWTWYRPGGNLTCLFTANRAVAEQDLAGIAQALENYAVYHSGIYPAKLEALLAQGEDDQSFRYMRSALAGDPWRRPYTYKVSTDGREFRVLSLGRDGKAGGSGDDEELSVISKPATD